MRSRQWFAIVGVAAVAITVGCDGIIGLGGDTVLVDASIDGATEVGADSGGEAGPGFCAALAVAHVFCADFDEGLPTLGGWDPPQPIPQGQSSVELDVAVASSPPASLRARIPQLDGGGFASALVQKSFEVRPSHVTLAFDARVEAGSGIVAPSNVGLAQINLAPDYSILLVRESGLGGALGLDEFSPGATGSLINATDLRIALAAGRFVHVQVDLSFGSSGSTADVVVDGQTAPRVTLSPTPTFAFGPNTGSSSLYMGARTAPMSQSLSGSDAHIDNVMLNLVPGGPFDAGARD